MIKAHQHGNCNSAYAAIIHKKDGSGKHLSCGGSESAKASSPNDLLPPVWELCLGALVTNGFVSEPRLSSRTSAFLPCKEGDALLNHAWTGESLMQDTMSECMCFFRIPTWQTFSTNKSRQMFLFASKMDTCESSSRTLGLLLLGPSCRSN